jgi:hypothetical protein
MRNLTYSAHGSTCCLATWPADTGTRISSHTSKASFAGQGCSRLRPMKLRAWEYHLPNFPASRYGVHFTDTGEFDIYEHFSDGHRRDKRDQGGQGSSHYGTILKIAFKISRTLIKRSMPLTEENRPLTSIVWPLIMISRHTPLAAHCVALGVYLVSTSVGTALTSVAIQPRRTGGAGHCLGRGA